MGAITISPSGVDHVGLIDISAHQFKYSGSGGKLQPGAKHPDWQLAIDRGMHGIIARIGNGSSFDESFTLVHDEWQDHRSHLDLGCYYYAQPNVYEPHQAVDKLAGWLQHFPGLTIRGMLDFEQYYGTPLAPTAITAWLWRWFAEYEAIIGHQAMVYWGNAFANPTSLRGSFASLFSMQPRYSRAGTPPVEVAAWAQWARWIFPANGQPGTPTPNSVIGPWDGWQFTSSGNARVYGCPDDGGALIDCNLIPFHRYGEALIPATPNPPQETDMIVLIRDVLLGGAVYFADTLAPCGDELFAALNGRADVLVVDQTHEETTAAFLANLPQDAVRKYDDFAERATPPTP
jgi:hypothetical protein